MTEEHIQNNEKSLNFDQSLDRKISIGAAGRPPLILMVDKLMEFS
jgi:hypothetical protein